MQKDSHCMAPLNKNKQTKKARNLVGFFSEIEIRGD